jgi:hypothetical protein
MKKLAVLLVITVFAGRAPRGGRGGTSRHESPTRRSRTEKGRCAEDREGILRSREERRRREG